MRLDLAKERKGRAAGGPVIGRGRGEPSGIESADVVEGDVWGDVVERGGDDGLELSHVECITVTGRHVEEGCPYLVPFDLLIKYQSSHSISTPVWRSSYPNRGIRPC